MRPTCTPCQGRECQWPLNEQETQWRTGSEACELRSAARGTPSPQFQPNLSRNFPAGNPRRFDFVSTESPEIALQYSQVFRLFRYYRDHLASWYDLNDSQRHFTDIVSVKARSSPLVLSAILAFSAISLHNSSSESLVDMAEFYHFESVHMLLDITGNIEDVASNGEPHDELLAAICLLRSFEIISRKEPLFLIRQGELC